MKRLFIIGSSIIITSVFPIITIMLLGIITGNTIISNVFSIVYPCQFISLILINIFSTGANIKAKRENNKNCILSGMVLGVFFGLVIFLLLCIFVNDFLIFMNADIETYKVYTIYYIVFIFLQMILCFDIEKLCFEGKEKLANVQALLFGLINLFLLCGLSLFIKNSILVISITLSILLVYVIFITIPHFKKFALEFNILSNIKYNANSLCANTFMFLSYLIGLKHIFGIGGNYITAVNFVTLITDPFWDMADAVKKCSQIDNSNNTYNFKNSFKNSCIFIGFILIFITSLYFALFKLYEVDLIIGIYFLLFQIFDFIFYAFISTFMPFVQIIYSYKVGTTISFIGFSIRLVLSLIVSTYCTSIAQIVEGAILFFSLLTIFVLKFKLDKSGKVLIKSKLKN